MPKSSMTGSLIPALTLTVPSTGKKTWKVSLPTKRPILTVLQKLVKAYLAMTERDMFMALEQKVVLLALPQSLLL